MCARTRVLGWGGTYRDVGATVDRVVALVCGWHGHRKTDEPPRSIAGALTSVHVTTQVDIHVVLVEQVLHERAQVAGGVGPDDAGQTRLGRGVQRPAAPYRATVCGKLQSTVVTRQ